MIRIIIINSLPNSVLTVNPFPDQNKIVYSALWESLVCGVQISRESHSGGKSSKYNEVSKSRREENLNRLESQCGVWEEAVFTHNLELSDSVQFLNRWKVYQKHTGLYHLKEHQCSFGSSEGLGVLRKKLRSSALHCPGTTAPLRRSVCCEVRGVWCCVKAWLTDSH